MNTSLRAVLAISLLSLVACRQEEPDLPVAWVELSDGRIVRCHDVMLGRDRMQSAHQSEDGWIALSESCSESIQGSDFRATCKNQELEQDAIVNTLYLGQFAANAQAECESRGGIWNLL